MRPVHLSLLLFSTLLLSVLEGREALPLNEGWRFIKGDPADLSECLDYDLRPEVGEVRDDKAADSRPEEAARLAASTRRFLKPWILPSGNAFIADPAKRHRRPAGNPGATVAYVRPEYDDSSWQQVCLPHDWAIAGPWLVEGNHGGMGRLPSWGIGWYRNRFEAPASDAGQSYFLELGGAMSYSTVWLNGELVGGWPYGYSSYRLDLTPHLRLGGTNVLAIRLDNPPASSRWYPGGGLYRKVALLKTGPVRVAQWSAFMRTPEVSANEARLLFTLCVENATQASADLQVRTRIHLYDTEAKLPGALVAEMPERSLTLEAAGSASVDVETLLAKPRLWGPKPTQQPNLYVALTELVREGRVVDEVRTVFGVRSLQYSATAGLLVNGERVQLRGVNMHHDLGSLGAAFNRRAAQRQLEMLQEMGCNALRMSHNPPDTGLLELADEMGFLVIDESFDCWERKKTPLDFHLIFPDWHEQDMRALVRRDRNHPSVILWSVGNEVGEQYTGEAGAAVARRLCAIVREEDPTRPTTAAMNFAKPDMPLPAELDVISLNYQGEGIRQDPMFEGTERIRTAPQYQAYLGRFPDKMILSSETASAFSSRGIYLFPVSARNSDVVRDGRGGDDTHHHVSAYELHAVDFGSSAEKVFASLEAHPFVAGEFVWTGWDHLGEPTPYYSSRSAYAGIIDLAGFKKDRFWLYQSHWRPDFPMAHLLPHWTWPERIGLVTPVHVFSSGDEVELFLNGRSLGRRSRLPGQYRFRWDEVVYEPGRLEAVAYRAGRRWATDTVCTAGEPSRLELSADRLTLAADGEDLCFVSVHVVDSQGTLAPRAENRLDFTVEGPCDLVSTDNGDPTSFEPFQSASRNAFSGKCLAIIRTRKGQPGILKVRVGGEGLPTAELLLRSSLR